MGREGRCEGVHVRVRVWRQDTRDGEAVQVRCAEVAQDASIWGGVRASNWLAAMTVILFVINPQPSRHSFIMGAHPRACGGWLEKQRVELHAQIQSSLDTHVSSRATAWHLA